MCGTIDSLGGKVLILSMKNIHLARIILFGTVVLACLMIVQLYWFNRAFDVAERQFDHSVQIALKKVADSVSSEAEVKKLSSNFFFVSTTAELNSEEIGSMLEKEFVLRSVNIDYELGVYNAEDDTLVYGKYVDASGKKWLDTKFSSHADQRSSDKNFAVYFPSKKSFLVGQLGIWIFSTILLLLMMLFFAFAISSLLRERRFAELKTDFINNMTHEFKTPVTNINIAAEILKNKMAGQDANNVYIDILLKENEKLRQKIDTVLLGSSSEYQSVFNLAQMDIHQLIKECAETFQMKVEERKGNIQLEFQAKSSLILGDRELLAHAITNVIDNAEKYSPTSPDILVRTRDHDKVIEIDIVDRGIGIPPGLTTKVFDKFFRVKTGDVHNVKGFGLGLNFVRNVIKSHKGHISLSSELNSGTQVTIFLPRA
jgi:two-component system, OmpR family, phosphate regulon sensor histidine kinase PhoR